MLKLSFYYSSENQIPGFLGLSYENLHILANVQTEFVKSSDKL